jgi:hypothetical protein
MLNIDELGLSRAPPSSDSGLMCDPKNRLGLDVAARGGFIQDWIRPSLGVVAAKAVYPFRLRDECRSRPAWIHEHNGVFPHR